MFEPPDYAIIEGTEAAYLGFLLRDDRRPPPPGAMDLVVPVSDQAQIGCRVYPGDPLRPSVLFFHGNGETVCDYDNVATLYANMEINFFVAGYRGYAFGTGIPTFPKMLSDAHAVYATFQELLTTHGFNGARFVMGRSMGSHSAVELAAHHPAELRGLILESGVARPTRALDYLRQVGRTKEAEALERLHLGKVRAITLPTLMIHGAQDQLVPWGSAQEFFNTLTMDQKRFETIPGAGHNDILGLGWQQYMAAIQAFVREPSRQTRA